MILFPVMSYAQNPHRWLLMDNSKAKLSDPNMCCNQDIAVHCLTLETHLTHTIVCRLIRVTVRSEMLFR